MGPCLPCLASGCTVRTRLVGDTIYRPQGLAAYRGGTISCPFRSLVHVPLDGTGRMETKKEGGGWDVRIASGWGRVVTSRDVKGVIVAKVGWGAQH